MRINFLVMVMMAICSLASAHGAAANQTNNLSSDDELLADMKALALKCVVRPYSVTPSGLMVFQSLRSTCPELELIRPELAVVQIEHQTFFAQVTESRDSDGGDLDDLVIRDAAGRIYAERHNVLAFDNAFMAIAGGSEEFPQIRE